jgi:serine/threonine protein kinase
VYESKKSVVYRAVRESDKLPVIVKLLRAEYPTHEELALFAYEYEIAKELDLPGVIKTYCLENVGRSKAIIMEDFGAISLDRYISAHPIDLNIFFQIAILLTDAIGDIHKQNIFHKSISPQSILINPETKEVKITDFGIATKLPVEVQIVDQEMTEDPLSYISPEQTGRMNRPIDYRTDFYSLGITFYEMLTRTLPFIFEDPLEIVHAHIARIPVPPSKVRDEIPPVISKIVMKLLSKTAEERYQGAAGLKADLEKCRQQLQKKGAVEEFDIGRQDIPERFRLI